MISTIKRIIKKLLNLSPTQMISLGFAIVILTGALLLTLPISSRNGDFTSFSTALFTSTSATCVTGLVVVDTYINWSGFGQAIILLLIQIGGLGFMTIATLLSFFLRRNISMRERIIISQSYSLNDMTGVVRIAKHVLIATFAFEGAGAVILSARFIPEFGFRTGIIKGIFHSVSAFCNAGFDIMGQNGAFSSLTPYVSDIAVNFTIMGLIVIGGIGFYVWEDIYNFTKGKRLSFYSKLVVGITTFLIIFGAIAFFILEYTNPETFANLTPKGKVLAAFFQSVTPRTAGFNTINTGGLTDASKVITTILMFIGGSSGSTAGGIKTVTAGIILLAIIQVARGRKEVVAFNRKISNDNILRALSIAGIGLILCVTGSVIICIAEGSSVSVIASLFETVSAFGTVGLTTGITPTLSLISRFVLIMLMYFGRVGILTITYSIISSLQKDKSILKYPEGKILIG